MSTIAELKTILTVENSNFVAGMRNAGKQVNSFAASARTSFNSIATVATGAASVAIYAIGRSITHTTEQISQLVDTSRKLGTSVAALQGLQYAASQAGIGAENLNAAMSKMLVNISKAGSEGGSFAEPFERLGLNIKTLVDLKPEEQFLKITEGLQGIQDPAMRAQLAVGAFGKGGLSVLNGMQDNLRSLAEEFKSFGNALSDEQAEAVERFGDSIGKTSAIFDQFKGQVLVSLIQVFQPLVDQLNNNEENMKSFAEAAKTAAKIIKIAFEGILIVTNLVAKSVEGWKLAVDSAALAAAKLAEIRGKARLQDARDFGDAEAIKKASAEYYAQTTFVKTLGIEIAKAAAARKALTNGGDSSEKPGTAVNRVNSVAQEMTQQKSLTEGYNAQLEIAKQAVDLQNKKLQGMRDEQSLLNDLVESRGGELERFNNQAAQAKRLQEELGQLKEQGPRAAGSVLFGKGRSLLDTEQIDNLIDKFKELQEKVSPEQLVNERLKEIQQAFVRLTDPSNQFGAGNTDRQKQVELKVVVQAQEGLEAKIAQSKANKDVILNTVNEQFNAAAREIY